MTCCLSVLVCCDLAISTHTLTWSVTDCERDWDENVLNFNSHAHVERDRNYTVVECDKCNFNSHAHVERDEIVMVFVSRAKISTHTLTWSVTATQLSQ